HLPYTTLFRSKGDLSDDRVKAFQKLGIDLTSIKNNSKRDGFTKWANRAYEIAEFIKETGHYPKAGKDKKQGNLYQSLARTKRARSEEHTSELQIELINELNIELD